MTKTMLQLAYDHLKGLEDETFNKLWTVVARELKPYWKEEFKSKNLTMPEIENRKKTELYKLMTIDGRFLKGRANRWTLTEKHSFEKINNIKSHSSTLELEE